MAQRLAAESVLSPALGERESKVPRSDAVATVELLELLYRQMRKLVGPRPDIDDLVQTAAERAVRALPSFHGRSALSTWTYSIAYRTWIDHQRWYYRWARRFTLVDDDDDLDPPALGPGADAACLQRARIRRLHAALAQLPPAKRAVIVLHDLEELEMREVAAVVGANERTVRSRLRDGRKKLARILTSDPAFDGGEP